MLYHCNQLSGQNGVRYCGSNDYGDNRNNQRTIFMDCQCIPVGLYIGATDNGLFIDTVGLKLSFAICAAIWGLATMGHALTGTWSGLAFMRALMGFSEASAIPAGVKTASTWFPAKERGVATGVFNMGTSLGAMLAPPLIAWCIMFHSWQFAFIVSGSLALLAALFWFFCYKDPKDAKRLSDEERHYIESGQEQHLKTDKKEKRQSSISSANVISGDWHRAFSR